MTLIKKIVMGLLLVFGGLVILFGMTVYNLKSNSVYYARQMPHKEGTEPDLVMLLENMGWLYMPEIEGIKYDNDGANVIIDERATSSYGTIGDTFVYSLDSIVYRFDSNFTLDHITDFSDGDIPYETEERKVKQELRHMLQPVLDAQTKPLVNLQWLFNYLYQDRFD